MAGFENKQIKSRKRVADHGEVFTSEREVNAMLDLVQEETARLESRFLEPACGTGNFLVEILRRKLAVAQKYRKNLTDYEKNVFVAVCSIYGIDILYDNVHDCQERLFAIIDSEYKKFFPKEARDEFRAVIRYILEHNILWGDALTMCRPDCSEPIVFSEWVMVNDGMVKRRDYLLSNLVEYQEKGQLDLFTSDIGIENGKKVVIPRAIKDYPVVHFSKVDLSRLQDLI